MKRRQLLKCAGQGLVLTLGPAQIAWGARIVAVRVWPAADYTRVTIESDVKLQAAHTSIDEPPRLAVDLQGLELNPALRELVAKVKPDDPNISGVRVGQFAPGVVRLVLDLKQASAPQVFSLEPVPAAGYQHRLVFDLYPAQARDPLQALITEKLNLPRLLPPSPSPSPSPPLASASVSVSVSVSVSAATASTPAASSLGLRAASAIAAASAPAVGPSAPNARGPSDPLADFLSRVPAPPAPAVTVASTAVGATSKGAPRNNELPSVEPGNRARASSSPAAPSPAGSTTRFVVVAIDPGHGGEDPGAIGPAGTREKDVVLAISLKLRDRINATTVTTRQGGERLTLPMRAFLTRDADFFVPLAERVRKSRRVQADLMISVHADAFTRSSARGASVFALSTRGASSAMARYMAEKENAADLVGGVNVSASKDAQLQRALLEMSTVAQINDSLQLGDKFLREIGAFAKLHKPRVEQAGFAVLKAPDIPSVLVETAFISNPEEEQLLRSEEHQHKLADALMRGIERYFSRNPPLARVRAV